ncbi:nickel pincer cofactor biosynthesis protein LarB [candidate division KSB1 bacterium]|nr:nickel pincer cofactor biosynthesis protein LarB [candidate division KSB1 bacterium]
MDEGQIKHLLRRFQNGDIDEKGFVESLKTLPFEDLSFAHIDHHRALRQGWPETIFCQGKTTEHIVHIAERILANQNLLLATRISAEAATQLLDRFPGLVHNPIARTVASKVPENQPQKPAQVALLTAGTSDMPVAEEAAETLTVLSIPNVKIYDVGVAGIHRLFDKMEQLQRVDYIIVAAGMEGALASVVGGLVGMPVVAVPTSVGYGASFQGMAALLAMLNSCAAGVSVVNIDNGFGAACVVARHVYHNLK